MTSITALTYPEEDRSTSVGTSNGSNSDPLSESNEGSYPRWIQELEPKFGGPMVFPYHVNSGYSVALGITSSGPDSGSESAFTPCGSLSNRELLESLQEDFVHSQRPPLKANKSTPLFPTDHEEIDTRRQANHLIGKVSMIQKLGSFGERGLLLCKLHKKIGDFALRLGDFDLAGESLRSLVALRTAIYARHKTPFHAVALAESHTAMANFSRDQLDWDNAIAHYQAALSVWKSNEEDCDCGLQLAETLYHIGQTVLLMHNSNAGASLKFLQDAKVICDSLVRENSLQETSSGSLDHLLGKILVAKGDACIRTSDFGKAESYYKEGLSLLTREGKYPEDILDALVALGDFHCSNWAPRGNTARDALAVYQRVGADYDVYPDLYEYVLLKRGILFLYFYNGDISNALEDISEYLLCFKRRFGDKKTNLAQFVGLLSSGACFQSLKMPRLAELHYEEAYSLVASPDCALRQGNPMLETMLWNYCLQDEE